MSPGRFVWYTSQIDLRLRKLDLDWLKSLEQRVANLESEVSELRRGARYPRTTNKT